MQKRCPFLRLTEYNTRLHKPNKSEEAGSPASEEVRGCKRRNDLRTQPAVVSRQGRLNEVRCLEWKAQPRADETEQELPRFGAAPDARGPLQLSKSTAPLFYLGEADFSHSEIVKPELTPLRKGDRL